jgi:uncharacterized membrane protein
MENSLIRAFIKYFLRGLLFTAPIFITFYVLVVCFRWIDGLIPIEIPGIGVLIIISSITLLGLIGSTVLARPLLDFFVTLLEHIPVVNSIYTSLKDVVSAFVGDNKKFKSAVLITLEKDLKVKRIGFITETDLSRFGQTENMISVYVPDSYGMTGNLFVVPKENIEIINLPVSEVMKFVVSGGITKFQ